MIHIQSEMTRDGRFHHITQMGRQCRNVQIAYFWKFPFNTFRPQLTTGNRMAENEIIDKRKLLLQIVCSLFFLAPCAAALTHSLAPNFQVNKNKQSFIKRV